VFDLSLTKIMVLGVLALIIFGPDQLPKLAAQAGRALRDLRRIAENAKADLQEGLGPEFQDFDINDLNPRSFVRKHLWEEFDATGNGSSSEPVQAGQGGIVESGSAEPGQDALAQAAAVPPASTRPVLSPGENPPYDAEAT
jgi:sec-independent protein translocase protein TatB